jgi:hypothetical protein
MKIVRKIYVTVSLLCQLLSWEKMSFKIHMYLYGETKQTSMYVHQLELFIALIQKKLNKDGLTPLHFAVGQGISFLFSFSFIRSFLRVGD